MDVTTVLGVAKEALYVAAIVSAPSLLTVLAVGLLIGLLQAATQIQEMTLAFIPKLIALVAAIIIAGAWMLGVLIDFTTELYHDIPVLIG